MTETAWLWTGCIGMALGALALLAVGKHRTQDEEGHTILHVVVPVVASLSYLAQATQQGAVALSDGREFLFARYVDWAITTPLLLLGLAMTALHGAHRRPGLVAAILGADVLMIVTGGFYAASVETGPKWIWYLVSCGAFLAVYAGLFGPLRREAQNRDSVRRVEYHRNVALLAVLWLVYPVLDLLGDNGLRVWGPTATSASITVLDLTSKIVYGFVILASARKIAEHDLSHGLVHPAPVSTAAVPSGVDPHRGVVTR